MDNKNNENGEHFVKVITSEELEELFREKPRLNDLTELDSIDGEDAYTENSDTFEITFLELAIFNRYFHSAYRKSIPPLRVLAYGYTDSTGMVSFGSAFDPTQSFWFLCKLDDDPNDYIFHTKIMSDQRGDIITRFHVSTKKGVTNTELDEIFKKIRTLAFNNSEYTGKCIKVKMKENQFKGIEIITFEETSTKLILSDLLKRYIDHFINRLKRGGSARYLLNGQPGTGKTQSIRDIVKALMPEVTFVIPDFTTNQDLTIILEACGIFNNSVIIMDDIDLYLGSRDNGNYTKLLGEFLSFFDGVKKRRISLLASTNDKGLVDKAAERPGRFNLTLDYTFLDEKQVEEVCKIHLPKEYHTEEVFKALQGSIGGKKAKITGAFIANLAENIREMAEDQDNWGPKDTISLIEDSYKGFYSSQVENNKTVGFNLTKE